MNPKKARWFVLGYSALLVVAMNLRSEEMIGISTNWTNGEYSYRTGSAPWALAFAAVGIALYALVFWSKSGESSFPVPQLFRRWLAGAFDFLWAVLTPTAFIGLAGILIEYRRTGVFDWLVERQQPEPGDVLFTTVAVLVLMFAVTPAYFVFCWWRGKPTLGSCVFNFRIVADEGEHLSLWKSYLRALLGSVALLAWPCWILAYWVKRDRAKGKFWLDMIFKTHAEFIN